MPPSPWPYLDHPGPLAIAHRGGAGEHPENTMAAFAASVALGYRYLETDVQVTADGVALAFHDSRLDRVAGRSGRIRDLRWAEIATVRVGGEPIPRLDDLLGTWPDARFNLDPKQDRAVAALADAVTRTNTLDRVGIAAFSDRRLASVRRLLGPEVCTALGPAGIAGMRVWSLGRSTRGLPAACLQIPTHATRMVPLATATMVRAAHRRGLQVHVWTVNQAAEMERLLDLGVDGLMTDHPTVLRDVLLARNEWVF